MPETSPTAASSRWAPPRSPTGAVGGERAATRAAGRADGDRPPMSELTLTLLRLGLLVLLWIMVLSVVAVLRRDLFGTQVTRGRTPRARPGGGANRPPARVPDGRPPGPARCVVWW